MFTCPACSSFVPATRSVCPACGSEVSHSTTARIVGGVLTLAGGSVFAMTLSACYGAIEEPYYLDTPSGDASVCSVDMDSDGYCATADCDDMNPLINPGATDTAGDMVDSDCGGTDGPDL